MPTTLGKLAICDICDAVFWLKDWQGDWDNKGCPNCIEQTKPIRALKRTRSKT